MAEAARPPATKDYREDRMSFDVEAGLVTGCVVG